MPAPRPAPPALTPAQLQAQAAIVRRWATGFAVLFALALGFGLWRVALGQSGWSSVTLPASMLLINASTFVKHRPPLHRLLVGTSLLLLLASFWLSTRERAAAAGARGAAPGAPAAPSAR